MGNKGTCVSGNVIQPFYNQPETSSRLDPKNVMFPCHCTLIFILTRFTYHVSTQVNTENGYCAERKRNVQNDEHQKGTDLWNVTGQRVCNGLLQVVEDQTA